VKHDDLEPNSDARTAGRGKSTLRGARGVYKRGGKWLAVVEYPADASGARRRKWSSGFATRKEAEAERDRLRTELRLGIDIDPKRLTVGDLLKRWLAANQPRVGARTWQRYQSIVDLHLVPELGGIPLAKLRPLHVEEALARWSLSERKDRKKGRLSTRTIAHIHLTLATALNAAVRWNLIPSSPCRAVRPPKVVRHETPAVDAALAAAIVRATSGTELGAISTVALGTGLRRGELLALTWADLDLESGHLTVRRSLEQGTEVRFKEPKTRRSRRTVVMPRFVREALRKHRLEQGARFLRLGLGRPKPTTLVFERMSRAWNAATFSSTFYRAMKAAGLPVRFHDLRHGFATLSLRAGVGLKTVSESLGHETIAMTADTYSHVLADLKVEAADKLDASLEGAFAATASERA
jgi:integrase